MPGTMQRTLTLRKDQSISLKCIKLAYEGMLGDMHQEQLKLRR